MFHVEQAWREAFAEGAQTLQIPLSSEQLNQFQLYLKELLAWNRKVNLTSITDEWEVAVKHFLDSLAVTKALGPGSVLDVGSGAGFPGLPLKIFHSGRDVTLLEPNQKKTAFLRHLIGTLRLSGTVVISRRLEELAREAVQGRYTSRFAHIVTRALAVMPAIEDLRPLLAEEGRLIWCRAHALDVPVEDRGFRMVREVPYTLPGGFGDRVLTVLQTT